MISLEIVIDRPLIEGGDLRPVLQELQPLSSSRIRAMERFGSVSFSVHGYADDPRALYEIPEVCAYLAALDERWPYWLFFLDLTGDSLQVLLCCLARSLGNTDRPDWLEEAVRDRWLDGVEQMAQLARLAADTTGQRIAALQEYLDTREIVAVAVTREVEPVWVLTRGGHWTGDGSALVPDSFGWHPARGNLLLAVGEDIPDDLADRVQHGALEFAVAASGPLVVLMLEIPGWGWQEAPMAWIEDTPQPRQAVTVPGPDDELLFTLVLVDSATTIIKVMRPFNITPGLTRATLDACAQAWSSPITPEAYRSAVQGWQEHFPDVTDVLPHAVRETITAHA